MENKLNWNKIKIDYPNAFKALVDDHLTLEKWGEIDNPEIWDIHVTEEHYIMRHLFDFFDSKNVIITIEYCKIDHNKKVFKFDIQSGDIIEFFDLNTYEDRISCEVDAWMRAFSILEKNIFVNDLLKKRKEDLEVHNNKRKELFFDIKYEDLIYPLRYPKVEYPKHLIYIKDDKFNRDFMYELMGEPFIDLGNDCYIEINLNDKTYSYTPEFQLLYRDPPPLATLDSVRYIVTKLNNK